MIQIRLPNVYLRVIHLEGGGKSSTFEVRGSVPAFSLPKHWIML
jgi:hypothetical protein